MKKVQSVCMIALVLGKKNFIKAVGYYLNKFDGKAASLEDFLKLCRKAPKDLSGFLPWFCEATTPIVSIKEDYNPKQNLP